MKNEYNHEYSRLTKNCIWCGLTESEAKSNAQINCQKIYLSSHTHNWKFNNFDIMHLYRCYICKDCCAAGFKRDYGAIVIQDQVLRACCNK